MDNITMTETKDKNVGPVIAIIIILLVIILGGVYFWVSQQTENSDILLPKQDAFSDVEASLDTQEFSDIDASLNSIDAEFDAALGTQQ